MTTQEIRLRTVWLSQLPYNVATVTLFSDSFTRDYKNYARELWDYWVGEGRMEVWEFRFWAGHRGLL